METTGSRRFITVFWRKPLHGPVKIVFYFFAAICLSLILVVPTYVSLTFYKNHNAEKELQNILDAGTEFEQLSKEVRQELDDYDQIQAKLHSVDPGSHEYNELKESGNALRQDIASKMPALVESYDEEGLPVLMTYKEYVETTLK
ncbi:MAG: hypothetical protein JW738_05245 [Actinobacteria bacterium]|nr:hypothetical protein [Actinomycetota bacterium]